DGKSKAWTHVNDAMLPPISAISGTSASDVWIGGGSYDSVALFHLEASGWEQEKDPIADAREIEGPIVAIAALGASDVVVATDGPNFSNLLHYDGAWKDEDDVLTRSRGDVVHGFVHGPNGALWAVKDPVAIRTKDGKWNDTETVLGTEVNGIAFASDK